MCPKAHTHAYPQITHTPKSQDTHTNTQTPIHPYTQKTTKSHDTHKNTQITRHSLTHVPKSHDTDANTQITQYSHRYPNHTTLTQTPKSHDNPKSHATFDNPTVTRKKRMQRALESLQHFHNFFLSSFFLSICSHSLNESTQTRVCRWK